METAGDILPHWAFMYLPGEFVAGICFWQLFNATKPYENEFWLLRCSKLSSSGRGNKSGPLEAICSNESAVFGNILYGD